MTGWSVDEQGDRVARALQDSGARALLHFAAPPAGARAPLRLINPRWAQPFEIFSRALGMPSSNEADPSALLAVAVPLMFGYMFGDMGQGSADRGRGLVAAQALPHRTAADGEGGWARDSRSRAWVRPPSVRWPKSPSFSAAC